MRSKYRDRSGNYHLPLVPSAKMDANDKTQYLQNMRFVLNFPFNECNEDCNIKSKYLLAF